MSPFSVENKIKTTTTTMTTAMAVSTGQPHLMLVHIDGNDEFNHKIGFNKRETEMFSQHQQWGKTRSHAVTFSRIIWYNFFIVSFSAVFGSFSSFSLECRKSFVSYAQINDPTELWDDMTFIRKHIRACEFACTKNKWSKCIKTNEEEKEWWRLCARTHTFAKRRVSVLTGIHVCLYICMFLLLFNDRAKMGQPVVKRDKDKDKDQSEYRTVHEHTPEY